MTGQTDTNEFNGVKVFSATKPERRGELGEVITCWVAEHQHCLIVDKMVLQSSDAAFHCLTIILFYWENLSTPRVA
ncbi:hypothetical protein EXS71_00770 [Candidatus Uhrbacteria bacterium]|nr:hypothetical protein [Candidatus Uhrbacteria bacterium]